MARRRDDDEFDDREARPRIRKRKPQRSEARRRRDRLVLLILAIGGGVSLMMIAIMAFLMAPAVKAAQAAAGRAYCTRNLKQIGLALMNYHSEFGVFPGDIRDPDGQPLLSWRVALLQQLDPALFEEFHLDEGWDSAHNEPLVQRMPAVYKCSARPWGGDSDQTEYQGFAGPGAIFDPNQGVTLASVTDGSNLTIALTETNQLVPWTKPEDIAFNGKSAPVISSHHPGGWNVLALDGSVKFIKESMPPDVFRALITRNGNEKLQ